MIFGAALENAVDSVKIQATEKQCREQSLFGKGTLGARHEQQKNKSPNKIPKRVGNALPSDVLDTANVETAFKSLKRAMAVFAEKKNLFAQSEQQKFSRILSNPLFPKLHARSTPRDFVEIVEILFSGRSVSAGRERIVCSIKNVAAIR